jgi:hypothetical protein
MREQFTAIFLAILAVPMNMLIKLIRRLLYLTIFFLPGLIFVVQQLSQFMATPTDLTANPLL